MTFAPTAEDFENLRAFIEFELRRGFRDVPHVIKAATEFIFLSSPRSVRGCFEAWEDLAIPMTQAALAEYQKQEETWCDATDNDRLDCVFQHLEKTGIAAKQNFWCCQTCAVDAIHKVLKDAPPDRPYFGYVFFDEQDTEFAMREGILTITFGSGTGSDERASRVAARFMNTATLCGLDAEWNGDPRRKIRIPIAWRHRLTTQSKYASDYLEPHGGGDPYKDLDFEDDPEPFTSKV